MVENKEEKKISNLRPSDKRETQRKSLKEKEMEEAIQHELLVAPKIYYEDNDVNDIHIWLDALENYSTIYIGPFISKDGKGSHIGLRYTIDSSKDAKAKISNDPKDEIISDWLIGKFQKIKVNHNKLNTGIIIEKISGVKGVDDKVEKSLYIPIERIFHIVTNENPYNKFVIEK